MNKFLRALATASLAAGTVAGCRTPGDLSAAATAPVLSADVRAVVLRTGGSAAVTATLRDAQGRLAPIADVRWRSSDTAVAVVVPDTLPVPGAFQAGARIIGRAVTGGATRVYVEAGGRADSVAVAVVPARFDMSLVAYAGTPRPDTIVRPALLGPPYEPPDTTIFTAPDTLILKATAALHFDTSSFGSVAVWTAAGRANGYVVARSPTQLKLVFAVGAAGRLVVRNLVLATGDSTIGDVRIDSLVLDSVAVRRQYFPGTVAVVGDTMTVTAGGGTSFNITGNFWDNSAIVLGSVTAAAMIQTSSQIRVLSPVAYTGPVTIQHLIMARADGSTTLLDSIKATGVTTIAAAVFPGSFATGGRLLDTVVVAGADGAEPYGEQVTVPATYPCAGCSYSAFVTGCCLAPVRFIAPVGVNGPIRLTVRVGGASLTMTSRDTLVVSGTLTGEPNEPGNDSATGATAVSLGTYVYGALNGSSDTTDYYAFPVSGNYYVYLAAFNYPGTGTGGAANPHFDAYVCDSLSGGICASERSVLPGRVMVRPGTVWLRIAMRTPEPAYVAYRFYLATSTP